MAKPPININLRGIRQKIPPGFVLGRLSGGTGRPELIDARKLQSVIVTPGSTASAGSLSDAPKDGIVYGRKNGAWVGSLPEAPSDGAIYGRRNGAWVVAGGGGSGLSPYYPPGFTFAPPLTTDFPVIATSTSTVYSRTDTSRGLAIGSQVGAAADFAVYNGMTLPSGDWTATAFIMPSLILREFKLFGLFFADSSGTGKSTTWGMKYGGPASTQQGFDISEYTDPNTFHSDTFLGGAGQIVPIWLRAQNVGGVVTYGFSFDGENFTASIGRSLTAWCTAPDTIGIMLDTVLSGAGGGGNEFITCYHWSLTQP